MRFRFGICCFSIFFFIEWTVARSDDSVRESLCLLNDLFNEDYQKARNEIVESGTSVLPELVHLRDYDPDWKVRLYAGICAERIDRGDEIDSLIRHRWDDDPETAEMFARARLYLKPMLPPGGSEPFRRKLEKEGLWFLYLESYAEKTNEQDWFHVFMGSSALWFPRILQNQLRLLAGHIAEENVKRNFNNGLLGGPAWQTLMEFVSDGTYPEGRTTLLEHLDFTSDFPYCAIETETNESTILSLLEQYSDNKDVSGILRYQLYRIRLGETSTPLRDWALTVPNNRRAIEQMIVQYKDDRVLVAALSNHLQRLQSADISHSSNISVKKPNHPQELTLIVDTPEQPTTEVPTNVHETCPRRNRTGYALAAIATMLAVSAFFLLKRRCRP